jgi:hypothetical protein
VQCRQPEVAYVHLRSRCCTSEYIILEHICLYDTQRATSRMRPCQLPHTAGGLSEEVDMSSMIILHCNRQGIGRMTRLLPDYHFGRLLSCQAVPARRTPSVDRLFVLYTVSYLNH